MLTRKKRKNLTKTNDYFKEWLAVCFKDDNVLYMCPNVYPKQSTKIGLYTMIKWKDGFKYKAKILTKGSEEDVSLYLSKLGKYFYTFTITQDENDTASSTNTVLQKTNNTTGEVAKSYLNYKRTTGKNILKKNVFKGIKSNNDDLMTMTLQKQSKIETKDISTQNINESYMTEVVNNSLELTSDSGQQQSTITDVSTENVNEYYPVKALYENVSDIIEKQNYVEHNETDFDELTANLGLPSTTTDVSTGNVNDYYPVEALHENIAGTIEKQNYVEHNETDFDELTANLGLPSTTTDVSTGNVNDYYPVEALHENKAGTIEKQNYVEHNVTDFDELTAILDQQSATTCAFNQNFNKSYSIETLYKDLSEVIELQNVVAQDCDDANVDILTTDLDQQSSRTGSLFESDTETQDRYPGLRPKTKNVKPVSNDSSVSSDYSEYDSDYVPQSHNAVGGKLYDSDKEEDKDFANSSDINIDEYEDETNMVQKCTPSASKISPEKISVPFITKKFNFDGEVEKSKKTTSYKRVWDKKDQCVFCEKNVTNFTRHILRKHKNEIEVIKYEALPKGSVERKQYADILRKRGNFLCNVESGTKIKPVRRPYEFDIKSTSVRDYLPCKYCLGMFKKKYLFRHFKMCKSVKNVNGSRNRAQADGQNMLITMTSTNEELEKTVFPRMASDNISFVAKSDALITAFGTRYLKCHKEKHLIAVVSQKMRTLARFLIAVRGEVSEIHSLLDCLSPKYFDVLVKCTKQIAQYNEKTDKFGSPSIILKLGQSLKQCCDIAEFIMLKESDGVLTNTSKRDSINNIKYMIEKQWSYEISSNACKEIYQNKWNKPSLLPLTSDIQLFRKHIINIEQESYNQLKTNINNILAFRQLQESLLVQIVLLNRRRSGEVQRILLETYKNADSEISQEEILHALSPIELELTKSFKRIVIRGKRGRGVPILFTPHIQKLINYLITIRESAEFIKKENPYLFPIIQSSDSSMRASDLIRKFGKESGAKYPENITSTRLRKHVATVTQLLNLTEGDIEQLATFMGHTKDVHKQFYRLSDNAFQVAKVSKLLLMMENGKGNEYRGKSLDEININVNELVSDEESTDNEEKKPEDQLIQKPLIGSPLTKNPVNKTKTIRQTTKKIAVVPWSEAEKSAANKYFKKHILLGKVPKKHECDEFLKLNSEFKKPWKKIKYFVHNAINSKKK